MLVRHHVQMELAMTEAESRAQLSSGGRLLAPLRGTPTVISSRASTDVVLYCLRPHLCFFNRNDSSHVAG